MGLHREQDHPEPLGDACSNPTPNRIIRSPVQRHDPARFQILRNHHSVCHPAIRRVWSMTISSPAFDTTTFWSNCNLRIWKNRAMTFQLTWLGTAGFLISSETHSILIDPYFSRLPLRKLLWGAVQPDLKVISAHP